MRGSEAPTWYASIRPLVSRAEAILQNYGGWRCLTCCSAVFHNPMPVSCNNMVRSHTSNGKEWTPAIFFGHRN
jgi:hypothetical protein